MSATLLQMRLMPMPHTTSLQVLRAAFPGTLLLPDVCAVTALPEVRSRFQVMPSSVSKRYEQRRPFTRPPSTPATCATLQQDTELLAAGFPCVDISRAGNRAGLDGQVRLPGVIEPPAVGRLSARTLPNELELALATHPKNA